MDERLKKVLSGVLSFLMAFSAMTCPMPVSGAETETEPGPAAYEAEYPSLDKVKDKLEDGEIVKAEDYTVESGSSFDVECDFSGLEIDPEKVKVVFYEAKNEEGRDFDTDIPDSYKTIYFVEPISGNPSYHVCRNLIVKEPDAGAEETAAGSLPDGTADMAAVEGQAVPEGTGVSELAGSELLPASETSAAAPENVPEEAVPEMTEAPGTGEPAESETPLTEETAGSEEPGTEESTEKPVEPVLPAEPVPDTEMVTEPGTERDTEPQGGPETGTEAVPAEDMETETESEPEPGTEQESETEAESETKGDGEYQVTVTKGGELGVTLDREDGSYDAGETVQFSTNLPAGSLTAAGALKVAANAQGDTADILYSEVTYHPDTDTFSFEMPADDISLEVAQDYAEGGVMAIAASGDGDDLPWDEATEIEANTYYYYSDGKLHPFHSAMGSGGNDSYKYVRYKVNGKTFTVYAYCMQHSMPAPPSGTTYKNMIELDEGGDDKYLRKALFYGYGGPGWGKTFNGHNIQTIMANAGCSSETRAMQHYLVDYLYDGESGLGGALSGTAKNMLKEIKLALKEMPDPTAAKLLPGLSVTAAGKDTETFTWKANEAFTLTIQLEKGVSLVNETTGKTSTGKVTVKGGDKFHLTATTDQVSSLSGNYAVTSNYPLDFHAMLLKLQSSQDIGFGYYTDSSDLSLKVDWPEQAQLDIIKKDAASGAKLAGAVYGVYREEACRNLIVQMPPTDANGASSVTLDASGGTVYLKELTAPKGYRLDTNAVGVRVSAGSTSTKELADTESLGGLKIYKEGEVLTGAVVNGDGTVFQYTNRRLPGAAYTVTAAEDIHAADGRTVLKKGAQAAAGVTTGGDGMAVLDGLRPGKYTVTETKAPTNYTNTGEAKTVTVTAGSQAETVFTEVTFQNGRQKAEVTVAKQDTELSAPLAGGIFALYAGAEIRNADGTAVVPKDTLIGKVTTGSDGHGRFTADLPVGYDYYVKEIQAPDGFLLNTSDVYRFSFSYTGETEAVVKFSHTFANEEPRGNLTICKEGEVLTGAAVTEDGVTFQYGMRRQKGAVYDVYAGADIRTAAGKLIFQKGAVVAENLATGEDGSVTLTDLYLGTYTVKEKTAPKNFVNKGEARNVTLSYNGQTERVVYGSTTFRNDRQKAAVTVTKVDDTTKNPLAGGIYGLFAAGDIQNADGVVVVNRDTLIGKATTGADGRAAYAADLPIGFSYYIKELQAPDGYVRNQGDVYQFTFSYTHDTEAAVNFSHTFENERVRAKISLMKRDAETGETPQGDAVLGKAVYGLYAREDIVHPDKKTGVIHKAGTQVATLTTDENGEASIGDLYLGKYYVKEITPSVGYLLDEAEHDLSCDFEGDLVAVVERETTSPEQVIKQPFQLIKAANNGKTDADLLSGVGFSAWLVSSLWMKEDGSYDFSSAKPVVIGENGATEIFTDNRGHAVSIAIPYGTYLVRETTTPHNFKPVEDFLVRITENHPTEPQVWRVLLDDEFEAKLKIIKKDDETKKPVLEAGTEFKVYDLDNETYVEQVTTYPSTVTHTSFFTDSEGYLILPQNLLAGDYRIEEVTAPDGYTVGGNAVEVKVDSDTMYRMDPVSGDAIIEVMPENHPVKGKLRVVKKGEVLAGYGKEFVYEEQPLAGAVFAVTAAEDIYTADYQKDADGNRICEYRKGELVAELTTGEDGEAVLADLPLGRYRVAETKAPEGYVRNGEAQEVLFEFAGQETAVVEQTAEFANERQRVQIKAVKKDAENGAALAGAVFGLYAKEDITAGGKVAVPADTLLSEAESGEDGCAVFDADLPFGVYYLRELQAPAGYLSSAETKEIAASYQGQEIAVAEFAAEFTDRPTVTEFTKSDITTGVELDGASLTVLDQDGKTVDAWTSVKDQPHVVRRLHVGETYTLWEEFAPYGYLKAEEVKFTVEDTEEVQKVEMKDAVPTALLIINKYGEFLDKVTLLDDAKGMLSHLFGYVTGSLPEVTFEVYAAEDIGAADGTSADYYKADELVGTITTDAGGIAQLGDLPVGKYYVKEAETAHGFVLDGEPRYIDLSYRDQDTPVVTYSEAWQNARQKAKVQILKKEKNGERLLAGGVFGLYAAEDIRSAGGEVLLKKDTLIEQRTTDKKGEISFLADLPVDGSFYIREIKAPDGFVTSEEKQEFVFEYAGEDQAKAVYEFVFEDEPTTVELTKTDLTTGKELPGAHLRVIKQNGDLVDEWVSGKEGHVIKELTVGETYELIETKPADGYVTAESIVFTVENTAEIQKHRMEDDVTKVSISKMDITGKQEVPGAKLTILDEEGQAVESWTSKKKPHYVEKLPAGRYTLHEETAPAGYLTASDLQFTVEDTGKVQKFEMRDDVTKVEVSKQDIAGKELPGAKLTIIDKDGKEVESWTSTEEPHYIEMLPTGEYTLHEESAPDGYLVAEDVKFTVGDTAEIQKVVMKDEAKPAETEDSPAPISEPPKTGDDTPILFWIVFAGLSACAMTISLLTFRKRKQH